MSIEEVPVISLDSPADYEQLGLIDYACREWGFFQVKDHGIEPRLVNAVQEQMRAFFSLSRAEKRRIERTETNPWGYFDQELTKNTRDWKQLFDFGRPFVTGSGSLIEPQWPDQLESFRPAVENYYHACEVLALRVLELIALALGEDPCVLKSAFRNHTSFLRLNYYPVCPAPEIPSGVTESVNGHLGLNRHTDSGALTLLLQDDQPGLQVYRRDRWYLVPPIPGAITVNIGDIVQVWSNDQYRAALHRVIANPLAERFSIPFFLNPSYEADYRPLDSTVSEANPARYSPINWGEFRTRRVAGDYSDQGEEIQIEHYRQNKEMGSELYRYDTY